MTIVGLRKPLTENQQLGYDPTDYVYINETIKLFFIDNKTEMKLK